MNKEVYDLKSTKLPYLVGLPLKLFTTLLESPIGSLLIPSLLKSAGITAFRKKDFHDDPTNLPIHYVGELAITDSAVPEKQLPSKDNQSTNGFNFPSIFDYAKAYREGNITPVDVAQNILEKINPEDHNDPAQYIMIACYKEDLMAQAIAATDRIKKGKANSILDGVPIAVKDEVDMLPYPTTAGTQFLGKELPKKDSTVVARMRATGAMMVGKANMHEIGINVTGLNPHHGTPRNPYNQSYYPGGSSSGSGVAVGSGLVPVAIGADGGGSIRIPASFCGVVGLKSTFGRISEFGATPLDWSVAHLGPLAGSATDAALAWGVMAGPDLKDPISLHQPSPTLTGWQNLDLRDLKLGVFWPWFKHASMDMVKACEKMLEEFKQMGAKIVEISIPDLEATRVAHLISIASEMTQAMDQYTQRHQTDHGLDVRTNLALARAFTARDYIKAQRVRTQAIRNFNQVFQTVDVILTPTTGIPAPKIKKGALPDGDSDLTTLGEIMRYAQAANLTGFPAISFPVGYNENNLPLGMQAMGRAWEEQTLLRLALASEQIVEKQKPNTYYSLLN